MPPNPRHRLSLNPHRPAAALPRLYPIVDAEVCAATGRTPADVARAFLSAGATWLQLRCKSLPSGRFLELAVIVAEEVRKAGATLIINDRADVTALSGAHGLHIGQTDLSVADARAVIGESAILGLSTHRQEQWAAAVNETVTYIAIGPTFGTATKQTGYEAIGLEMVTRAASAAAARGLATVAIGGITIENARSVIDAGAASVAVISDLLTGDPEQRCRAFLHALR